MNIFDFFYSELHCESTLELISLTNDSIFFFEFLISVFGVKKKKSLLVPLLLPNKTTLSPPSPSQLPPPLPIFLPLYFSSTVSVFSSSTVFSQSIENVVARGSELMFLTTCSGEISSGNSTSTGSWSSGRGVSGREGGS